MQKQTGLDGKIRHRTSKNYSVCVLILWSQAFDLTTGEPRGLRCWPMLTLIPNYNVWRQSERLAQYVSLSLPRQAFYSQTSISHKPHPQLNLTKNSILNALHSPFQIEETVGKYSNLPCCIRSRLIRQCPQGQEKETYFRRCSLFFGLSVERRLS